MAEIIDFQQYKNMKEEEKKRLKLVSTLSNRCDNIDDLLHSINDSIGVSFVTKHFGEMNQIVGREYLIDDALYDVVVNALSDYKKSLNDKIVELNKCI